MHLPRKQGVACSNHAIGSFLQLLSGCLAQWPEHEIADLAVTGSNPVVPLFLVGVVGNISACHADARGSIPRHGDTIFFSPASLSLRGSVPRPRSFSVYASIAQLAEHLLRKEKVTSSILVGGCVRMV